MLTSPPSRRAALWLALLVSFLWSTSWVLIKIGLHGLPALTFAGLRYFLAFLLLAPLALRGKRRAALGQLTRRDWLGLGVFGLLGYSLAQGAQFTALAYLPAATVSLIFNFSPVLVAGLGALLLNEIPAPAQWLGVGLALGGALLYFGRVGLGDANPLGLTAALTGLAVNSLGAVVGRRINRSPRLHPYTITLVSLGLGAGALLAAGVGLQGLPWPTPETWAIIGWLALVNTALAFTLWNHIQRSLTAVESSLVNNLMLVQIAALAWIFLGEALNGPELAGLALTLGGTALVQAATPQAQAT